MIIYPAHSHTQICSSHQIRSGVLERHGLSGKALRSAGGYSFELKPSPNENGGHRRLARFVGYRLQQESWGEEGEEVVRVMSKLSRYTPRSLPKRSPQDKTGAHNSVRITCWAVVVAETWNATKLDASFLLNILHTLCMSPFTWSLPFFTPETLNKEHDGNRRRFALIILNQPFAFGLFQRLWDASEWRCCADGGANRLHDAALSHDGQDERTRYVVTHMHRSIFMTFRCQLLARYDQRRP